ncbi:MAG: hypothetical protein IT305_22605 [Chloroflexi bacterium]|nr:hypothetical protein [Chloroflexota bacterium]
MGQTMFSSSFLAGLADAGPHLLIEARPAHLGGGQSSARPAVGQAFGARPRAQAGSTGAANGPSAANNMSAPDSQVRPMVFTSFAIPGRSASAPAGQESSTEGEAAPAPPPDFEALAAEARNDGFRQGYQAGYARGYTDGLQQAADEQQATTSQLAALLRDIGTDAERFVRDLENEVVELALAVAEKVIAREARLDRSFVVEVVRSALAEVHDSTELRIHVHPDDYALIEPRWAEMLPRGVVQQSELIADHLIEPGGVLVETRIGHVDGQLKTRLNQIVTGFQAVLDGEPV